jgi:dihydroxyacid dehydratase/phosphogluconate dehydratase
MAYMTGRRIVEMVEEDLTPSKIMTRKAFENAIRGQHRDRRFHQRAQTI